jgi:replicative DNA helicase
MHETPKSKIITQEEARVRWLKSLEQRDGKKYFSSGFKSHDQVAGRLLRGSQYIIAARPGVGKTAFMVSLARNLAHSGINVVYASLEIPITALESLGMSLR